MRAIVYGVISSLILISGVHSASPLIYKNVDVAVTCSASEHSALLNKSTAFHMIKSSYRVISHAQPGGMGSGVMVFSQQRKDTAKTKSFYSYIITCQHVIGDATTATVESFFYANNREIVGMASYACDVVINDATIDIAVLELKSDFAFNYLTKMVSDDDYEKLTLYDPVHMCGSPLGVPPLITSGHIANFNLEGHYQVTAPIIFGCSGGLVATNNGKLFGIARMIPVLPNGFPYANAGLIVPHSRIKRLLKILDFGFVIDPNDKSSSLDKLLDSREEALRRKQEAEEKKKAEEKKLNDDKSKIDNDEDTVIKRPKRPITRWQYPILPDTGGSRR